MLNIILLGLNHKTAPVELREKLAFSGEEVDSVLDHLHGEPELTEVVLFSTCNRVEVLAAVDDDEKSFEKIKEIISDAKDIPVSEFENAIYFHRGDDAVRHMFRVASSLDSMMLGEPQILGQVKSAYNKAAVRKTSGVILNRLLHKTFCVAKRVRSETGIGDNAVSISYAAIELGRKIFGSLEGKTVLLVGAGEMAELAVEHLIRHRAGKIFVANRTFERGADLAGKFNGSVIRFEEIADALSYVDIIISSTGARQFVITRDMVKGVMKKRRNSPLFFIDIAVPRDIDPTINKLDNAYVYDIDDLTGIVEENIEERGKEAVKGERLVDEAVISFRQWYDNLDVVPTIIDLRKKLEKIAGVEVAKTLKSLGTVSEDDILAIKRMTDAIITKMLHDPICFLKNPGDHRSDSFYLNAARTIFKLDE